MYRKIGHILVCLLLSVSAMTAQDALYSQFYASPTLINPAFAGNSRGGFMALNYRNQWPNIDNVYTTYSIAYDKPYQRNVGLGIYVNSDNAGNGAVKTNKVSLLYVYKVRVNRETFLKGGIEVGYGQTSLDWQQLVFYDNLHPRYGVNIPGGVKIPTAEVPNSDLSRSYADIGAGVLYYSSLWYGGISIKHINSPDIDFVGDQSGEKSLIPVRYTLIGGLKLSLNDGRYGMKMNLYPNLLLSKQSAFTQVTLGAYVDTERVYGGLWYRHGGSNRDAAIASIGVKAGIFKIGYSYDYTISELGSGSGGSHEIGISLLFDKLLPKEYQYSDCFGLFR